MFLLTLLQTITPEAERIANRFSPDTLASRRAQLAEIIRNTPPRELVEEMIASFIKFGIKLLIALLIYLIGAWIIKKTKNLIAKAFTRKGADATLTSFIKSLVSAVMWILLIVIMISTLGINTTSLAALLAAGGMAIGMALSGTLQNFAGGIMLLIFKPFKAGDFIEAQGFTGVIKEINIVSTKITTPDNREVILPNGALFNGSISNYNNKGFRRVESRVCVCYGSPAEQVKEALLDIVSKNGQIVDSTVPGAADPFVALAKFNDSSVEFLVRVWVKAEDFWPVTFWLNENIYTELPRHGISFPFPQLDVHLKKED